MHAFILKSATLLALCIGITVVNACHTPSKPSHKATELPTLLGGQASHFVTGHNAFSLPSQNMPMSKRLDFSVGNSFFRNPWVIAPSTTTARDGLGPLFNTNACQNCHIKDGRGLPPNEPGTTNNVSLLVRVSLPTSVDPTNPILRTKGALPLPGYGLQIQNFAIAPNQAEADVRLSYSYSTVTLADGTIVELRKPTFQLNNPAYGPLPDNLLQSARIAPPMIGLGLLQSIPHSALLAKEDPEDLNGDGISGRLNRVWDIQAQHTTIGRFGWKAGQPSISQQNAAAFHEDLGITSALNPSAPCAEGQPMCLATVNGGEPELSDYIQQQVDFYSANLAVPARRSKDPQKERWGATLFETSGCEACHNAHWTTGESPWPWLAHQNIYPYTDLLLHDMGPGLADHRPEFSASGQEWRTPPLWGIGLTEAVVGHAFFLHDGRARNLTEAILWHDGEARASRDVFMTLTTQEREALLSFLQTL